MVIEKFISEKIKILSLLAIVLVLYIHSGFHNDELSGMNWILLVQRYISGMIGRIAVPLFYIISGYLFFLNTPKGITSVFIKIKKRISSLLIPYIFSAIFFIVFGVFVALTPGTSRFMNGSVLPLFDNDLFYILKSIFYGINGGSPMAFQLWFLRDLIILVFLSPIWYLLFKLFKWYWCIGVFILLFLKISYFPFYALFWFSIGGSLISIKFKYKYSRRSIVYIIIFLTLGILELYYPMKLWEYIQVPVILIGIVSIWLFYDLYISEKFSLSNHHFISIACSYTFFIYLYHEPTLNIIRKFIVFILGKNEIGYLFAYMFSPWGFLLASIAFGIFINNKFPSFFKVITGGR